MSDIHFDPDMDDDRARSILLGLLASVKCHYVEKSTKLNRVTNSGKTPSVILVTETDRAFYILRQAEMAIAYIDSRLANSPRCDDCGEDPHEENEGTY